MNKDMPIDMLSPVERKLKKLELAVKEKTGYKKEQAEFKLINFKRLHFPSKKWVGKEKGTYINYKKKRKQNNE
ncbi:MAG: hypothetical protein HFH45_01285 [Bacilli bacterium]|nr:hypothetical protein [Bacilli bacterium]